MPEKSDSVVLPNKLAQQLVATAEEILSGRLEKLAGLRRLRSLTFGNQSDELFLHIAGIDSDSDLILEEHVLQLWTEEFQIQNRKERKEFLEYYDEDMRSICEEIVERYGDPKKLDVG